MEEFEILVNIVTNNILILELIFFAVLTTVFIVSSPALACKVK